VRTMRRKLISSLVVAGVFAAGFGASVFPASAEQRQVTVTFAGGTQQTITIDAPPCTPIEQLELPAFPVPVVSVTDPSLAGCQQPTTAAPGPPVAPASPTTGTTAPAPAATTEAPAPAAGGGGTVAGEPQTSVERQTKKAHKHSSSSSDDDEPVVEGSLDAVAPKATKYRTADGVPKPADPSFSLALPGPAPIGVPNFFIEKFTIPPFLLSIYQAAGIQYGVRWEVLAAINAIETDYGRNLNVSTAGAVGWMQFLPSTWKRYGVDANEDGEKDPYNPVDAIFGAARYLKAAGAQDDLRKAIFAYNHADWYVDQVLLRAQLLGGLPADLVGSLTGLTQGHFPVAAKARYADDLDEKKARKRVKKGANAAVIVKSKRNRRGIRIFARRGAPAIAVQDGVVKRIGHTKRLGKFLILQDAYGNRYTYAHLGKVAAKYPVARRHHVSKAHVAHELKLPKADPAPTAPASAGSQAPAATPNTQEHARSSALSRPVKQRLFANPTRPNARVAGGERQLRNQFTTVDGSSLRSYFTRVFKLNTRDVVLKRLRQGSRVAAGTILGRIGKTSERVAPHLLFEIRPAGRGAPRIDPKPILDGWKLLESTAIYRAAGKNPFFGPDAKNPSVGQILLMSKEALQRQVLHNSDIDIYSCGRRDIRAGVVDRRVLATLEFLAASGLKPTVSALECGHSYLTKSGNVSEHSSGNAVDIAAINGIPIVGHQGAGSVTDLTIRRLLSLQGTMQPHQIISLMQYEGAANTFSMADHADHIHVGFRPLYGSNSKLGRQMSAILKPNQWIKLMSRLGAIDNPIVPTEPSKYAISTKKPDALVLGD
jgi:hypothetical protein